MHIQQQLSSNILPPNIPPAPVDAILENILTILSTSSRLVVSAAPGAGKTTHIPLALLSAAWRKGKKILILEPRRMAAKAAALRMASLLGEKCGHRIGYAMRMEQCVSRDTTVEVITEGLLSRMLQQDPELSNIACIIFDEFHERSLNADFGLALCLECQEALRPDLRIIAMSATLEVKGLCAYMKNCPAITSKGHAFPVDIVYSPVPKFKRYEEHAATIVQKCIQEESGGILVFLPGMKEIQLVYELLENNSNKDVKIFPLYASLSPKQQEEAILPSDKNVRKVILATAVAETSLTIEDISIVVDCGYSRSSRYDRALEMNKLLTKRVSIAQAEQRAGRAGRTSRGKCFRLWNQLEEINFKQYATPEISNTELSSMVLNMLSWGALHIESLKWLTPPPDGNFTSAVETLKHLGAVTQELKLTHLGKMLLQLPVHPRLGKMLLHADDAESLHRACLLVSFLEESQGKHYSSVNILSSLENALQTNNIFSKRVLNLSQKLEEIVSNLRSMPTDKSNEIKEKNVLKAEETGKFIALAWPERIAQKVADGQFRMRSGQMTSILKTDELAKKHFLAIAGIQGDASHSCIYAAVPLSASEIEKFFHSEIVEDDCIFWDASVKSVQTRHRRMLGALLLAESTVSSLNHPDLGKTMLNGIHSMGIECLPWSKEALHLLARAKLAHTYFPEDFPDFSNAALLDSMGLWLLPYLEGFTKLEQLSSEQLLKAVYSLFTWKQRESLDALFPSKIRVPSGSLLSIDYTEQNGPVLSVKLQEVFGLTETPTIANGKITICMHLNSPAGRPLQVTRDLKHFWNNAYASVRAEMRGRYPKHPWPENPLTAIPSKLTKKQMKSE